MIKVPALVSTCGRVGRRVGVRAACRGRRTVHLGGHDGAGEDTAADRDHAGEGALLVDVVALNGVLGRAEAQTDILVPSPGAGVLARAAGLVVQEDVRLSQRISIELLGTSARRDRGGWAYVPASGKRAPTGHCHHVSICCCSGRRGQAQTYVSSVAMVAVVWLVDGRVFVRLANSRLRFSTHSLSEPFGAVVFPGAWRRGAASQSQVGLGR
jgi:hypothetical protein